MSSPTGPRGGIGPDTRQDRTIYDPTCGSGSLLIKAFRPPDVETSVELVRWLVMSSAYGEPGSPDASALVIEERHLGLCEAVEAAVDT